MRTSLFTHFKPLQPVFGCDRDKVQYREELPHLLLQPYICCYWELQSIGIVPVTYQYQAVVDGCTDIFISADDPRDMHIAGFTASPTGFLPGRSFRYIGIRFLPGMFSRLTGISASELCDCTEELAAVLPALTGQLAGAVSPERSLEHLAAEFDRHLLPLIARSARFADSRFDEALYRLISSTDNHTMEKGLQTGLSARHLRRLFHLYVGDSPKVFAGIVRFQRLLRIHRIHGGVLTSAAWLEAGYYDQAHFIREFKRFSGFTPGGLG